MQTDDDEIRALFSLMLVAGGETTDQVIAFVFESSDLPRQSCEQS
jgi:cytochrome P450